MVKLLLDTNAALFLWMAPERLTPTAHTLIAQTENILLFSQVSTWEICLKYHLGKLPLPEPPAVYLRKRIRQSDLTYLPITDEALFRTVDLPPHHHDPFDRLLIATAQVLGIPILTADKTFCRYPLAVFW